MREIIRLVLVLGLVGFISGGALGAFYKYTAPIVEARQMQEVAEGLKAVVPDAKRFEKMDTAPPEVQGTLFKAFDDAGKTLGIVFETIAKGFVGDIKLLIGIEPENKKVISIKILGHQETPGVGTRIEEPGFLGQFKGKSILDNFQIGQDIDALSGATVSAKAVAKAVGLQTRAVLKHLGQDVGELPPPVPVEQPPLEEPVKIDLPVLAGELWTGMGSLQLVAVEVPAAFSAEEKVYLVKSEKGENLGLLLVVIGNGYGGPMQLAVGMDKDLAKVTGIRLLENKETPGLGTKVGEEPFVGQFVGKPLKDTFILGQDVDGITMATVSAQGVVDAVREKTRVAAEHFKAGIDAIKVIPQQISVPAEPAKDPAPKPAPIPAPKPAPAPVAPPKEQPAPPKPPAAQVRVQDTVAQELWSGKGKLAVSALAGTPSGFAPEDKAYLVKTEKGDTLGILLLVYGKGYGGPMQIAIALDKDLKSIVGVKLLENKETPGLGTKVGEAAFTGQFAGKQISGSLTIGQDLDGITMATVSAEAFANTVREKAKAAADFYRGRLGS
ncbi:MAG: RnfABCDGE type electron transport complex subunit G [Syntrophomonadaceae bacterium]|nr:RnfABCDGE type electron transport complex subunit G [Syntrophomonadaceae bacterium]